MKGCWILANDFLIILFIYFLAVLGLHCCEGFSLVVVSQDNSLLLCWGFSLWWLLLFQSTGSVVVRTLLALRHVGSSQTGDRTCVPCIDRQILNH